MAPLKPTPNLAHAFSLAPENAVKYFENLGYQVSANWREAAAAARSQAFSVAGAMSLDILQDVRGEIQKALNKGTPLGEFQKDVTAMMERKGWSSTLVGAGRLAPWHLETIYRTNMQSAFMAGQYKENIENAADRPWWKYQAVMDARTRPAHAKLNGRIYRFDDPFWQKFYPPNGYSCFPAGTPIATPSGWRPIESIKSGDSVIGGSGDIKPVAFPMVRRFEGNIIRIVDERSLYFALTPNHRVLTMKGWIKAENLKVGDILIQIPEVSSLDLPIEDINKGDVVGGDPIMSGPIQRESPTSTTLNSKPDLGNKYINPVRAKIKIMDRLISKAFNMLKGEELDLSRKSIRIDMPGWVVPQYFYPRFKAFLFNVRTKKGRSFLEFFRHASQHLTVFLVFPLSYVASFLRILAQTRTQLFGGFSPSFGVIYPLDSHRIPPPARRNSKMSHEFDYSMRLHPPSAADLPIRHEIIDVEDPEGFTSGAPLDFFDSLDSFVAWAGLHCHLHIIKSISILPYSGNVYNLEIKEDNSYCIPSCVVHNCRCRTRALTDAQVQGQTISKMGPGATSVNGVSPDEGFDHNPGKAWLGNLDKYDYSVAVKGIENILAGPSFEAFFDGKIQGEIPIAVLSPKEMEVLGAKRQTVYLSSDSLTEHQVRHRDMRIDDYRKVPIIIAEGAVYKAGNSRLIYLWSEGFLYRATLKTTKTGDANYFISLFKTTEKDADKQVRNKMERIR